MERGLINRGQLESILALKIGLSIKATEQWKGIKRSSGFQRRPKDSMCLVGLQITESETKFVEYSQKLLLLKHSLGEG